MLAPKVVMDASRTLKTASNVPKDMSERVPSANVDVSTTSSSIIDSRNASLVVLAAQLVRATTNV